MTPDTTASERASENTSEHRADGRDAEVRGVLERLQLLGDLHGAFGAAQIECSGEMLPSIDPTTGQTLGTVRLASAAEAEQVTATAVEAFREWRTWPAPRRGDVVRDLGNALRDHKEDLGKLVTAEVGKILSEGLGEVQEMIDMADLAVGMSRQLYGKTMHSERAEHRMYEQWHPLGPVAIITAFNFPVAVWAWNATVAAVCGDSTVWKPSPKSPLTAIAVTRIAQEVLARHEAPPIFGMVLGPDEEVSEPMVKDPRYPLISATGSVRMGRRVGTLVAERLGRSLLELGGNNAILVAADADQELALRAIAFAAAGTTGQRCTTCRRIFMHEDIAESLTRRVAAAFESMTIGDPLDPSTLVGPLIDEAAVDAMQAALGRAKEQGAELLAGGDVLERDGGFFVRPALVRASADLPIVHQETFAPILYAMEFSSLDEVIEQHNSVPQGLSSALFTTNLLAAEQFLSASGSDCGIANINIGTSGAEIGGAFGGEKETGGGREAGSDSWKAYMRRQTCTINYGEDLPLAQGVEFDI